MKSTVILSALGSAGIVLAHGIVQDMTVDGVSYTAYDPYTDPYESPEPEHITWTVPSDGPVTDVTSSGITCNTDSTAGKLTAPIKAGDSVKFFWTTWPEGHKGPTMTYLAACPGADCTTADATTLDWFKINEAGLNSDGTWATDTLIADNSTWTVTIPSDIKSGPYLIRHELLALHSAETVDGAQFYPMCANLDVTGTGTAVPTDTVKFPGAYSATDPGILIDIYYPVPTSYTIPGPAVYEAGSASSSSAVASSAAATSSAETSTAASSTIAAVDVAVSSTVDATSSVVPTVAPSSVAPYSNTTRAFSVLPPYANTTVSTTAYATSTFTLPTLIQESSATSVVVAAESSVVSDTPVVTSVAATDAATSAVSTEEPFTLVTETMYVTVSPAETTVAAVATSAAPVAVTSYITQVQAVTSTIVQTIQLTKTVTQAITTITVAPSASASGPAECQCSPIGRYRQHGF